MNPLLIALFAIICAVIPTLVLIAVCRCAGRTTRLLSFLESNQEAETFDRIQSPGGALVGSTTERDEDAVSAQELGPARLLISPTESLSNTSLASRDPLRVKVNGSASI